MNPGYTNNVLDKGFVTYVDHLGSDLRIVESARISYKSPSKGEEQDEKLLRYLWRNKHTSPFEQCSITYNIKMPIFIMRQFVRHRTFRINEQSARYTKMTPDFYYPSVWRQQDIKNIQGSTVGNDWCTNPNLVVPHRDDMGHMGESDADYYLKEHCEYSYELYNSMLTAGIAREMARMVLPVNLYTEIYVNCDLHNLLHFIQLRFHDHAQWEIQQYAKAMFDIVEKIYPKTAKIFKDTNEKCKL